MLIKDPPLLPFTLISYLLHHNLVIPNTIETMQFSALAVAFLSTAYAFSPTQVSVRTADTTFKTHAAMVSEMDVQRPLYDPLGLYPKDAPERQAGLLQPFENSLEQDKTVLDPLNIYQDKSQVSQNAAMSASLPFLKRPAMLDGTIPGDRGFDPFNFSSDTAALRWYQKSEVKHARLAMLAAVGWPIAELFHKNIAAGLDLKSLLVFQDRVPSVLNGGLSLTTPAFWIAALGAAAFIEAVTAFEDTQSCQLTPGDFGFDPLGLAGETDKQKKFMLDAELFNGRLGMLAITGFAIQEWFTQNSIINQTPIFFKPLNVAFEQLMDAGANY
jgi:hypothetical protein